MLYKKMKFIVICALIFLFSACSIEASSTPELAIKEYLSRINQDQDSELQIIRTNSFGGNIMVFYKHAGKYCFQWVKHIKNGFIATGNPYLFSATENNFIDVLTIHGENLGNEFSAIGLYANDPRISYIKGQFSNGEFMDALVPKDSGLLEIFEGHVIIKSIIAYDKNYEVIHTNYLN